MRPVPRSASVMGHGDDFNSIIHDPVDEAKGKPLKDVAACRALIARPALRGFRHAQNGMIEVGKERTGSGGVALVIPLERALRFLLGCGVKANATECHAGALSPAPKP